MTRTLAIATQRMHALALCQGLAKAVNEALLPLGYTEPVAVAGGFCRDLALNRIPKDMDLFVAGGTGIKGAAIGEAVADLIRHSAAVKQVIPNYVGWADDLDAVVKVECDPQDQRFTWLAGCPLPRELDIVILNREKLLGYGYTPSPDNYPGDTSFLQVVTDRVDIRLNAIGTTATVMHSAEGWEDDALAERLVVQWSRRHAHKRLAKRLAKHVAGKFEGWSIAYETADGSLSPTPVED